MRGSFRVAWPERLSIFDDMHGAEFENADCAVAVAVPRLPEEYRSCRVQF